MQNQILTRTDVNAWRLLTAVVLMAVTVVLSAAAQAGHRQGYLKLSDALDIDGFQTLKFALDTTELTPVLDQNRVTLFAPTNDVFELTAQALGCKDALDLATRLINIPVEDSNALAAILTYHARLGIARSPLRLLKAGTLQTVNGESVNTGVNAEGLFLQGAANASPARITVEGIQGKRWVIFPIDSILLPFAPPPGLCD